MLEIPKGDVALGSLRDVSILAHGAEYRLLKQVGSGGMATAFVALRRAPEGETPVIVKMLQPWFVRRSGPLAALAARKEATSLARLNERMPPTPFVVRLIEQGTLAVREAGDIVDLPWIAIELVHGGLEGTSLTERVAYSVRTTGAAFDPARVAHMVECLVSGLTVVHEVGVIHRDLKPDNILACGFGDQEIFKIVDFGIARPEGVAETFGGVNIGTPGYAAPEQAALDERRMGPWTDLFGLGAVIFYALTNEHYFQFVSVFDALALARKPERRSIREAAALSPELRDRDAACSVIDRALAIATAPRGRDRPQSADVLAAMLVPALRPPSSRRRPPIRRLDALVADEADDDTSFAGWSWVTRHHGGHIGRVRSVAWDGDGRCLAATDTGLCFFDGTDWRRATADPFRFVHRVGAARWLIGGDRATLAVYSEVGTGDVTQGPDASLRYELASGSFDDLAVVVGSRDGRSPVLFAASGRRWLRPLPLEDVEQIHAITRIDDAAWLVVGRDAWGAGYMARYEPLQWTVERLGTAPVRALSACASQSDRGCWIATGTDGYVGCMDGAGFVEDVIPGGGEMTAAAIDGAGWSWVAGQSGIWMRRAPRPHEARERARWVKAGRSPTERAVSLHADVGIVTAVTANGAVFEGRSLAHA